MRLKFLCDENIPGAVERWLISQGYDVSRAERGSADFIIGRRARREKRIIITSDSDFANIVAFPPAHYFGIVRLRIDPPFFAVTIRALTLVLNHFGTPSAFRGKLIIVEPHAFRVWEKQRTP